MESNLVVKVENDQQKQELNIRNRLDREISLIHEIIAEFQLSMVRFLRGLILLGPIRAGKSVTGHNFCLHNMAVTQLSEGFQIECKDCKTIDMLPDRNAPKMIGKNIYFNKKNLGVFVWDPNGFGDLGFKIQMLINAFYIDQLFKSTQQLKFAFIVEYGELSLKAGETFIQDLKNFIRTFTDIKQILPSIAFIITKVPAGKVFSNVRDIITNTKMIKAMFSQAMTLNAEQETLRALLQHFIKDEANIHLSYQPSTQYNNLLNHQTQQAGCFENFATSTQQTSECEGWGNYFAQSSLSNIAIATDSTEYAKQIFDRQQDILFHNLVTLCEFIIQRSNWRNQSYFDQEQIIAEIKQKFPFEKHIQNEQLSENQLKKFQYLLEIDNNRNFIETIKKILQKDLTEQKLAHYIDEAFKILMMLVKQPSEQEAAKLTAFKGSQKDKIDKANLSLNDVYRESNDEEFMEHVLTCAELEEIEEREFTKQLQMQLLQQKCIINLQIGYFLSQVCNKEQTLKLDRLQQPFHEIFSQLQLAFVTYINEIAFDEKDFTKFNISYYQKIIELINSLEHPSPQAIINRAKALLCIAQIYNSKQMWSQAINFCIESYCAYPEQEEHSKQNIINLLYAIYFVESRFMTLLYQKREEPIREDDAGVAQNNWWKDISAKIPDIQNGLEQLAITDLSNKCQKPFNEAIQNRYAFIDAIDLPLECQITQNTKFKLFPQLASEKHKMLALLFSLNDIRLQLLEPLFDKQKTKFVQEVILKGQSTLDGTPILRIYKLLMSYAKETYKNELTCQISNWNKYMKAVKDFFIPSLQKGLNDDLIKNLFVSLAELPKQLAGKIMDIKLPLVETIQYWEQVIDLSQKLPKNIKAKVNIAIAHMSIGNMCEEGGDIESACTNYRKSLEANIGNIKAIKLLATLYEQRKEYINAIEYYKMINNYKQIKRCYKKIIAKFQAEENFELEIESRKSLCSYYEEQGMICSEAVKGYNKIISRFSDQILKNTYSQEQLQQEERKCFDKIDLLTKNHREGVHGHQDCNKIFQIQIFPGCTLTSAEFIGNDSPCSLKLFANCWNFNQSINKESIELECLQYTFKCQEPPEQQSKKETSEQQEINKFAVISEKSPVQSLPSLVNSLHIPENLQGQNQHKLSSHIEEECKQTNEQKGINAHAQNNEDTPGESALVNSLAPEKEGDHDSSKQLIETETETFNKK